MFYGARRVQRVRYPEGSIVNFFNGFNLRENYSRIYGKLSSLKTTVLKVSPGCLFQISLPHSHRINCKLLLLVISTFFTFTYMFLISHLLPLFCKLSNSFCQSLALSCSYVSELLGVVTQTKFHTCCRKRCSFYKPPADDRSIQCWFQFTPCIPDVS